MASADRPDQGKILVFIPLLFLGGFISLSCNPRVPEPAARVEKETRDPERANALLFNRFREPWKGDLIEISRERRPLRALVLYSRTSFFVDRGTPRGLEFELLHGYESYLNRDRKKKQFRYRISFDPVNVDQLIPSLLEGRGDIAAVSLTVTPERRRLVRFTEPYIRNVREIVVTSHSAEEIRELKDLSGKDVYVVSGSSHADHLRRLNRRLESAGFPPVNVIEVDEYLSPEDVLEMVSSGIFPITVMDSHIAELWSRVLKGLILKKDVVVNNSGNLAWAVRKEDSQLLESLNNFIREEGRQGTWLGNILFKRYFRNTRWLKNPLAGEGKERFEKLLSLFDKYADLYGFDRLLIAAQAYQESGFDPEAVSSDGALGIMQVLPTTAAEPFIGIPDIEDLENNIHAGVKYLAFLRDTYFSDPNIPPLARINFTLAAYNAGPGKVEQLRKMALERGLNPNLWFQSVEQVALQKMGLETVQYVANIHKYYIALRSVEPPARPVSIKELHKSDKAIPVL